MSNFFRSSLPESAFSADLAGTPAGAAGLGGTVQLLSASNFPVVAGEGLSIGRVVLEPCGINTPHVHPR